MLHHAVLQTSDEQVAVEDEVSHPQAEDILSPIQRVNEEDWEGELLPISLDWPNQSVEEKHETQPPEPNPTLDEEIKIEPLLENDIPDFDHTDVKDDHTDTISLPTDQLDDPTLQLPDTKPYTTDTTLPSNTDNDLTKTIILPKTDNPNYPPTPNTTDTIRTRQKR